MKYQNFIWANGYNASPTPSVKKYPGSTWKSTQSLVVTIWWTIQGIKQVYFNIYFNDLKFRLIQNAFQATLERPFFPMDSFKLLLIFIVVLAYFLLYYQVFKSHFKAWWDMPVVHNPFAIRNWLHVSQIHPSREKSVLPHCTYGLMSNLSAPRWPV